MTNVAKLCSLSLIMFTTLYFSKADASVLKIINQNPTEIAIRVIPGSGAEDQAYCWKCLSGVTSSRSTAQIVIPTTAFKGKSNFSVVGTTGGFLEIGRCKNLNAAKNYEITFLNRTIGTSCISREI